MEERHWTEDAELIERFVLNDLDPGERNELEDHLRVCEVCKQAVRAEQILVAGIRRSGRERFKTELKTKLPVVVESKPPWPHILSAAAVVVILLSVGIYNRWFDILRTPQTDVVVSIPGKVDSEEVEEENTLSEHTSPEPSPAGSQIQQSQRDQPAQRSPQKEKTAPQSGQDLLRDEQDVAYTGGGMQMGKVQTARPQLESIAAASSLTDGLWIEGTVAFLDARSEGLKNPSGQSGTEPTQMLKREAGRARLGTDQAGKGSRAHTVDGKVFLLTQKTLESLPAHAGVKQPPAPASVPAYIERSGDTVLVMLYLESLLDAGVLERAVVEKGTLDSLVITIPGRRIAFELPHRWSVPTEYAQPPR